MFFFSLHRPADASPIESTWDRVADSFDNMGLNSELLRGIYGYGFEKPSAIQQRAILPCIAGDVLFVWKVHFFFVFKNQMIFVVI